MRFLIYSMYDRIDKSTIEVLDLCKTGLTELTNEAFELFTTGITELPIEAFELCTTGLTAHE